MTNVITRLSTVGSPGLVVMVDNSRSKGRGFESQCHILDCLFEKTENKRKRGQGWPIFFKKSTVSSGLPYEAKCDIR